MLDHYHQHHRRKTHKPRNYFVSHNECVNLGSEYRRQKHNWLKQGAQLVELVLLM